MMFLETQAGDFLNAFEILKESNEAFIARQAEASGTPVITRAFGARPAMGVEIVCLAFSVELHIKALHYAISNETPRGHNILNLFRELPEWAQHDVFHHHLIAQYGWTASKFKDRLQAISDGFEKWRYAYESASRKIRQLLCIGANRGDKGCRRFETSTPNWG